MKKYLEVSKYIDWDNSDIISLAKSLSAGVSSEEDITKNCFEWVRDNIKHSFDYKMNPITCKASEVLIHKTGYCYAKSHLLVALLRANKIPAGLCYQRLRIEKGKQPYSLHGLNAVFLKNHGWYRMDARGNNDGINAQFFPPREQLAFPIISKFEADLLEIWSKPLSVVISVLEKYETFKEVYDNLPDIELIKQPERSMEQ